MTLSADILTKAPADYARLALDCLAPPQAADFWSWCQTHLRMPTGTKWSPRRAALSRRWYRLVQARLALRPDPADPHAHLCEQLWLVMGAQIVKTTFLHDVLLYTLRNQPRKVGLYMARLKDLKINRKTKVEQRLLRTDCLERLLPTGEEARERALGQDAWIIASSLVLWLCGNVADDARSHDLMLALLDEFDQYDNDVQDQGDPIEHILARQRTYRQSRLVIGGSTPGVIDGHAWRRLCSGSHERLLLECPACAMVSWANPDHIRLEGGRDLASAPPVDILHHRLARWVCPCGTMHNANALHAMIRAAIEADRWCPGTWSIDPQHPTGHWVPHADLTAEGRLVRIHPPEGTVRSAHASSLYSIDETLDTFTARMVLAKQSTQSAEKTFTNNERAEPYIISATELGAAGLTQTVPLVPEYHHGRLHRQAHWLAVFFDQQGNDWSAAWFPYVVRAFEPGGASWLVAAGKAMSHAERDAIEAQAWLCGPTERKADVVWMDSANGNVQFDVYLWAVKSARRLLLRGDSRLADGVPWMEVVDGPNQRRRTPRPAGVREWRVHPWHWRNELWARINGKPDKPAWWRPQDAPDFYLNSLTSEEQTIEKRRVAGGGMRDQVVWRPRLIQSTAGKDTFRTDNHWWDAEADHCAAANILGWDRTKPITPQPYGVIGRFGAAL